MLSGLLVVGEVMVDGSVVTAVTGGSVCVCVCVHFLYAFAHAIQHINFIQVMHGGKSKQ